MQEQLKTKNNGKLSGSGLNNRVDKVGDLFRTLPDWEHQESPGASCNPI